jgi:hypothetical protein
MKTTTLRTWADHELRYAKLGDARLNKRLSRLVADLATRPESSLPQATVGWAATKAAYRFFDNPRLEPDDIRAAHRAAAEQRLPEAGTVLALQDTTQLDFSRHPATRGLGYLGDLKHNGLLAHSVLLASADGVPLGVVDQHVWRRDPTQYGKRQQRRHKATADKESQRWLDALQQAEQSVPPGRALLTVADREADFYDLFTAKRRPGHDLLIRAKGRRSVRHPARLLGPALRQSPARGQLSVALPRADGRAARTATLTLRFGRFSINPPSTHPRRKGLPAVTLTAVLAQEEEPPAGVPAVSWLLLTSLEVEALAQAAAVVRCYSRRWLVERFHFVLKSGCRVEQLQLEAADRLMRALATYSIVAWRLLWLTYEARQHPEASCAEVFGRQEWEVLHRAGNPGKPLPEAAPSLREAVRQVARLGGFLARRGDGEPGVQTLWRGLRRLQDLVDGHRLTRQQQNSPSTLVGNG